MTRELHPEWRDDNEPTRYPFADTATLNNDEGDFIPETLFLDASIYPIGAAARMYLSQVSVTHETAVLVIGDETNQRIATATFSIVSPPDSVQVQDLLGRPAGIIVSESNRLATLQSWTVGEHDFTIAQTEFAARVAVPMPDIGFHGFVLDDGTVFTDDIWMVGEDGVVLRYETHNEQLPGFADQQQQVQAIRIDVVGDPLFRRRLCGSVFQTPTFLKTITARYGCQTIMCGPDDSGDFKLSVGSQDTDSPVLRIRSLPEGLTIETVGELVSGRVLL